MKRLNRTSLFFAISLTMLVIAALLFYRHYHKATPASTGVDYPLNQQAPSGSHPLSSVPAQSRQRAKAAGNYCPSWDAKPGEISSTICYPIYDDTAQ